MRIELILVPYDSGRRAWRMGAGPEHLLRSGLVASLESDGHDVAIVTLETNEADASASAFDLARQIAGHVGQADRRGACPVILAGNCIASLGGVAGLESRTALLWLDAHADFNTPQTSPSGFLDGMALAIITGRCMQEESETVAGYEPLADACIVMLGVRSVDEGERAALQRVQVVHDEAHLALALANIECDELFVHVDLDAIDPTVLKANGFATENGLSHETLQDCLAIAARSKRIAGIAVTAYDPAIDDLNAGPGLVRAVLRALLPFAPR